jgi:hypothetical protein
MNESLLSPSNIILFGRLFTPFTVNTAHLPATVGGNRFLREQLAHRDARLARIYAFTYEGTFYNLPKPAIYLVHSDGMSIAGFAESPTPHTPPPGPNTTPSGISASGVVARDFGFEPDVRFWEYDKGDFTLRCDIVSGTFEEVLLDAALSMTAPDALISRSDLAARSDLASRSDLAARSDVTSRSDLAVRHRTKG